MQGNNNVKSSKRWMDLIDAGRWVEVERSTGGVMKVPDPLWQELDQGGHVHRYVVAEGVLLVPGLDEVHGKLRCRRCGAVIVPGKLPPVAVRRGDWIINGEVSTKEVAETVMERLGRL